MKKYLLYLIFIFCFSQNIKSNPELPVNSNVLSGSKEDTVTAWKLAMQAYVLRDENPDSSINISDQAIMLSRKLLFNRGLARALNAKGFALLNKQLALEALTVYRESLPLSMSLKDPLDLWMVNYGIGSSADLRYSMDSAVTFKLQALDYALTTGDKKLIGLTYNGIGTIYLAQGKLNLSIRYLLNAAKNYEELNDTIKMAMTYNNLAIDFRNLEKYPEAIRYFKFSVDAARVSGNKKKIISRLNNLGSAYIQNNQFEEARHVLLESLNLEGDSIFPAGQLTAIRYLGNLCLVINKYDSALYFLERAFHLAVAANDKRNIVLVGNDYAEALYDNGKFDKVMKILDDVIKLAHEMDLLPDLMNSYEWMDKTYALKGDYKKAYEYKNKYLAIKDSIYEMDKITMIEEIKTQYETEKKDQQIEVLHKDKIIQQSELKRQETVKNGILAGSAGLLFFSTISFLFYKRKRDADLKQRVAAFNLQVSEVDMKALRAQMNPHFIFNSLRSINEFIQNHKTDFASEYLVKFSKLMRAILENSRKKEILLSDEMEVLELYMQLESQRLEYPFAYSIEIDHGIEPGNVLIPPMLLQPIVENAIWHGLAPKNQPGKIIIRIKKQAGTIQCEVEDNGIGREVSRAMNENNAKKGQSYGLKITAERLAIIEQTKKLKTLLRFDDLKNNNNMSGLNVAFSLPYVEAN